MNGIWIYLLQLIVTAGMCLAVVTYFRSHLRRILVDLCGTTDRARFWEVFSCILLVGMPLIFGMGYTPQDGETARLFFDAASQVRVNLFGFLVALAGIGFVVSIFALVAPRPAAK